jgi:pyruvate dehydrogenase complex dehydrogenase (E1) component
MNKINWKESKIDYDKLSKLTNRGLISSQPKSDDWKIKISKAHKGKVLSEETIEKLKEAKTLFGTKDAWNKGKNGYKGKPHSEETKQKIREKSLGKVISDKQKKDVSKKLSVPIIATNLKTGKQKEYKSTKEASTQLALTGILHVLKGRSKQCGGYFFEYVK